MAAIAFDGATYDCGDGETVLDALLRQGIEIPYSCKMGVCLSCLLKAEPVQIPAAAQDGLRANLREQGYFLACQCQPDGALTVSLGEESDVFGRGRVIGVERLAPQVCRVAIEPATPLYYRAGQFVNLRRGDGLTRSYSLASVPRLESHLELHVKRLPGGQMSNWIFDDLAPGDTLDIQGPNGGCYYAPGRPDRGLLLIPTTFELFEFLPRTLKFALGDDQLFSKLYQFFATRSTRLLQTVAFSPSQFDPPLEILDIAAQRIELLGARGDGPFRFGECDAMFLGGQFSFGQPGLERRHLIVQFRERSRVAIDFFEQACALLGRQ